MYSIFDDFLVDFFRLFCWCLMIFDDPTQIDNVCEHFGKKGHPLIWPWQEALRERWLGLFCNTMILKQWMYQRKPPNLHYFFMVFGVQRCNVYCQQKDVEGKNNNYRLVLGSVPFAILWILFRSQPLAVCFAVCGSFDAGTGTYLILFSW